MEPKKSNAKWSIEKVRVFVEMESNSGCTLVSEEYKNNKTKLEFLCSCGEGFIRRFDTFRNQKLYKCGTCANRSKWDINKVRDYVEIKSDSKCKLLSNEYKDMPTKMRFLCSCKNEFERSFLKFYYSKQHMCSPCAFRLMGELKRKSHEQFIQDVQDVHGIEYTILSRYSGSKGKVLVRHNSDICNSREYEVEADSLLSGRGCRECYLILNVGENNPSWNPDITNEERLQKRDYLEYQKWRQSVYERDDYTCQCCGIRGENIVAHHILNFAEHKELRTELSNGITLCEVNCHRPFHNEYGYRNNNRQQLDEFINRRTSESA